MSKTESKPTPAQRKWSRIMAAWEKSDLSVKAFCRRRHVTQSGFWYWKRLLGLGKPRNRKLAKKSPFKPVHVVGAVNLNRAPLELVLDGGHVIRIADDFDKDVLKKFLSILEEAK